MIGIDCCCAFSETWSSPREMTQLCSAKPSISIDKTHRIVGYMMVYLPTRIANHDQSCAVVSVFTVF